MEVSRKAMPTRHSILICAVPEDDSTKLYKILEMSNAADEEIVVQVCHCPSHLLNAMNLQSSVN